jgi:hypothetical protein
MKNRYAKGRSLVGDGGWKKEVKKVNIVMNFLYKNENKILKLAEVTIRELDREEKNRGYVSIWDIIYTYILNYYYYIIYYLNYYVANYYFTLYIIYIWKCHNVTPSRANLYKQKYLFSRTEQEGKTGPVWGTSVGRGRI